MPCGNNEIVDGGKLLNNQIVDPSISGGTSQGLTLENATLSGSVTLDQAVLEQLATLIKPLLGVPELKDCQGADISGAVATCADVSIAVNSATDPDKVAGVFKRVDGTKFTYGATLMTAQEIAAAINLATAQALAEACGQGQQTVDHWYKPTALTWEPQTGLLSLTETDQDGDPVVRYAQITGFAPALEPVSVPGAAAGSETSLPLAMHGGRGSLLGSPTRYLSITVQGQAGWIPFYGL